jgi:LuxR family maltose regulon positive regulatory protein
LDRLDEEMVTAELKHIGDGSVPVELWPFVAYLQGRHTLYFGHAAAALTNLRVVEDAHERQLRETGAAAALLLRARADLLMAAGDTAGAKTVLSARSSSLPDPLLAVARSRVDLLEGRLPEAMDSAAQALDNPNVASRERLELQLLQGAAAWNLGQKRQSAAFAEHAAETFGTCRSVAALLTIDDQVRRELLRLAPWPLDEGEIDRLQGRRQVYHAAPRAVRLSRGEQTALLSFERTASRKETAQQLYRSLNTVKTQLNSAYRKLGTSSREDALVKARALGLLPEATD